MYFINMWFEILLLTELEMCNALCSNIMKRLWTVSVLVVMVTIYDTVGMSTEVIIVH
jgi:hypothetical protein